MVAVPPAADDLDRREKRSKIVAAYAAIATSVASVATAALVGWLTFSLNAGNSRSADLKACLEQSEKSAEYAFSAKVFDGANEGARDALRSPSPRRSPNCASAPGSIRRRGCATSCNRYSSAMPTCANRRARSSRRSIPPPPPRRQRRRLRSRRRQPPPRTDRLRSPPPPPRLRCGCSSRFRTKASARPSTNYAATSPATEPI